MNFILNIRQHDFWFVSGLIAVAPLAMNHRVGTKVPVAQASTKAIVKDSTSTFVRVNNLQVAGSTFVINSRSVVSHNTSARGFADVRARVPQWLLHPILTWRAERIKEAARKWLPQHEAKVYVDYLEQWMLDPDASAEELMARTNANAFRPQLETIKKYIEWRIEKGASWPEASEDPYLIAPREWNEERSDQFHAVLEEANRALASNNITLKDYARIADGYLCSVRDYGGDADARTGRLWHNDFSRVGRGSPFFHVISDVGLQEINRGLLFGSGYVELLHPSIRKRYDVNSNGDAYDFGEHDYGTGYTFSFKQSQSLRKYLSRTIRNIRFYDYFHRRQMQQVDRMQALLETWFFQHAHEDNNAPGSRDLLMGTNKDTVEKYITLVQHPFKYRAVFDRTPTPREIYDSVALFSQIQLLSGRIPSWDLLVHWITGRNEGENSFWYRLEESKKYEAANLPDNTKLYQFMQRTDGWSMTVPRFYTNHPKGDLETPYMRITTAGELQAAGFELRAVPESDSPDAPAVVALPKSSLPQFPGKVVEASGWTQRDHTPLFDEGRYYDGTLVDDDTWWFDVQGQMHRGPRE